MFFVHATKIKVSQAAANRIHAKVRAIDSDASFVRDGNRGGWIQRPNDGWNSSNSAKNAALKMIAALRSELGKDA